MGERIRYGKARHCGYTWYCQAAGKEWATDPILGLRMEWRTGSRVEGTQTGWYLFGDDHFGEWLGRSFNNAMNLAWALNGN